MTQDIDLLAVRAAGLADELVDFLKRRFQIAVRVRQVSAGRGIRLDQVWKDLAAQEIQPPTEDEDF